MPGRITPASPKGGRPLLDTKSNEPNFQTDINRRFEKDAHANGDRPVNVDTSRVPRMPCVAIQEMKRGALRSLDCFVAALLAMTIP
jgi:hypothetical protein